MGSVLLSVHECDSSADPRPDSGLTGVSGLSMKVLHGSPMMHISDNYKPGAPRPDDLVTIFQPGQPKDDALSVGPYGYSNPDEPRGVMATPAQALARKERPLPYSGKASSI